MMVVDVELTELSRRVLLRFQGIAVVIKGALQDAHGRSRDTCTGRALSDACCGHNHFNDFVALHGEGGPFLCFGRVSGLSPPVTWEHDGGHLPFEPGGRVLAVRTADGQPAHVETWIQMAEASEDHIVLDPHAARVTAVKSGKVIERWRSVLLVFGVFAVLLRTTSRG